MTQISVAPQSMPVIAPPQAAAAPRAGTDAAPGAVQDAAPDVAAGDAAGADFAAVLKAQIALPAKDAPATEIFAALPSAQAADTDEETPTTEALLPVAPDLTTLLPALINLAGLMPPAATEPPPADSVVQEAAGIARGMPALAPATDSNADPALPKSAVLWRDAGMAGGQPDSAPVANMEATQSPANPDSLPQAAEAQAGEEPAPSSKQASWLANLSAQPVPVEVSSFTSNAGGQTLPGSAEQASTAITAPAAPLNHASPSADASPAVRVDTPVGSQGWDAEIGQKVVLLVNRQESRAELTLTPPHLGKVEVSISVNGDQTSASFVSASPAAREALEQALPRLREILADAGITLGQASVNAESARRDRDESPTGGRTASHGENAAGGAAAPAQWAHRRNGLIDTFA